MGSRELDQATLAAVADQYLAGEPLADAVLSLFEGVWNPEQIERMYEENRGRSYRRKLRFGFLVDATAKAVVGKARSFWRLVLEAQHAGEVEASFQAIWGKVGRVPIPVSEALVRHSAEVLEKLSGDVFQGAEIPKSLEGFEVTVLDGTESQHVPHRPKSARGCLDQVLGNRLVAALDMRRGLVRAIAATEDESEPEETLLHRVLQQVRAQTAGRRRLHVADRGYRNAVEFRRLVAEEDEIVTLYPWSIEFEQDGSRPVREGETADGQRYREEWGGLGGVKQGVYTRRIQLEGEEKPFALLTSFLDSDCYPAEDLLLLYKNRPRIGNVFQRMVAAFGANEVIACTPRGTVFQAAVTLVLYNVLSVLLQFIALRQSLRAEQPSMPTT